MATATQLLNQARSQVGYREGRGNNNKYGIWYKMNYEPYCAIGLSWCAAQVSGGLTAIGGRFSYCPTWANWFRGRGRFHSTGMRGDIVFFDWSGRKRRGQEMHVGIVEGVNGSYVSTIEFNTVGGTGNQSDGGGVYRRTRHLSLVVGFGRPAYVAESNVVTVKVVPKPYNNQTTRIPIVVDGVWGPATTTRLQQVLNIKRTGAMDKTTFNALAKWLGQRQVGTWSLTMKTALQYRVGVPQDGVIGPQTVRAFQRYLNRN
jgi:hypothetical protein